MRKIALIFILSVFLNNISAQEFYRFSSEYSVKYKEKNGKEILKLGKVFYDLNEKQIIIKNGFPVREILVYNDTTVYKLRNDRVVSKDRIISPVEFSIFHLALIILYKVFSGISKQVVIINICDLSLSFFFFAYFSEASKRPRRGGVRGKCRRLSKS